VGYQGIPQRDYIFNNYPGGNLSVLVLPMEAGSIVTFTSIGAVGATNSYTMNGCSGQSALKFDLTSGGIHTVNLEIGSDLSNFGCFVVIQGSTNSSQTDVINFNSPTAQSLTWTVNSGSLVIFDPHSSIYLEVMFFDIEQLSFVVAGNNLMQVASGFPNTEMYFSFPNSISSQVVVLGSVAPVLLTGNFTVTLGPPSSPVFSDVDPFADFSAMVAVAGPAHVKIDATSGATNATAVDIVMNSTCLMPSYFTEFATTPSVWMRGLLADNGFAPGINCPVATSSWSLFELATGDKNDSFTAYGVAVPVLVSLGPGNDSVIWADAGSLANATFDLGTGADTITVYPIQNTVQVLLGDDSDPDVLDLIAMTPEYPSLISQSFVGPFSSSNPLTTVAIEQLMKQDLLHVARDDSNFVPKVARRGSGNDVWAAGETFNTTIDLTVDGSVVLADLGDTRTHTIVNMANGSSLILDGRNSSRSGNNAVSWGVSLRIPELSPISNVYTFGVAGTGGVLAFFLPNSTETQALTLTTAQVNATGSVSVGGFSEAVTGADHVYINAPSPLAMMNISTNPCGADMVFVAPSSPVSVYSATNNILFVNASATLVNLPPANITVFGSGTGTGIGIPLTNTSTVQLSNGCFNVLPLPNVTKSTPSSWFSSELQFYNVSVSASPCAVTTHQMDSLTLAAQFVFASDLGPDTVRHLVVTSGNVELTDSTTWDYIDVGGQVLTVMDRIYDDSTFNSTSQVNSTCPSSNGSANANCSNNTASNSTSNDTTFTTFVRYTLAVTSDQLVLIFAEVNSNTSITIHCADSGTFDPENHWALGQSEGDFLLWQSDTCHGTSTQAYATAAYSFVGGGTVTTNLTLTDLINATINATDNNDDEFGAGLHYARAVMANESSNSSDSNGNATRIVSVDHTAHSIYGTQQAVIISSITYASNMRMALTVILADGENQINVANNNTVTNIVVDSTASAVLSSSYVSGLCFDREPTMQGRDFTLESQTPLSPYCFEPFRDCDPHGLSAFEAHNHEVDCESSAEREQLAVNSMELITQSQFSCTAEKTQWVVEVNPVLPANPLPDSEPAAVILFIIAIASFVFDQMKGELPRNNYWVHFVVSSVLVLVPRSTASANSVPLRLYEYLEQANAVPICSWAGSATPTTSTLSTWQSPPLRSSSASPPELRRASCVTSRSSPPFGYWSSPHSQPCRPSSFPTRDNWA